MCGIAGFYGFKNDNLIKKISKELEHRGPDGEGIYTDNDVTLLNRRLAIIDRAHGDQPIYNEDKTLVVVYNGEIYNYQELKKELEAKGHKFVTKSDTEVIVHGYEEWGETSFDRYNGMFAIALYDIPKKKLMLVRDHFGIKPLYFAFVGTGRDLSLQNKIIFSSEIKPIINSGLIEKKPNDRVIYRYLKFRIHDDREETFFKGVKRLMSGQMMIVQNGKFKIQSYTKLKEELLQHSVSFLRKPSLTRRKQESRRHWIPGQARDDNEIQEFRLKLIEAIKLRLISEVPVGTCLSGGLDSSTIVAVVNKLLKEKTKEAESVGNIQQTFSAVFPGSINDEEKYIDAAISYAGTGQCPVRTHKINPKPEEFFQDIEDFIRTQEEPTISTGPYAQYKVMEMAHKYVTVLLDGQGSDEMMAGYLPYYFVYLKELKNKKAYFSLFKEIISSRDVILKFVKQLILKKIGFKKTIKVDSLLNNSFKKNYIEEKFNVESDNLKKRLVEDIFSNSLQSLLRYEDRNSMRFSIEGRVPFLDFNLLKYIFSLDERAIIKNGWNKFILRESIKDLLPEKITRRRNKIGFTTPEEEWFLRMKNRIYSIFMSDSFGKRAYFNQQEVQKAFQKFIEGKTDDSMVFWRMLNVEMWLRIFFDPPLPELRRGEKERGMFEPNTGKKIEIKVKIRHPEFISGSHATENKEIPKQVRNDEYVTFLRFPIKTDLIKKGDDVGQMIKESVYRFIDKSIQSNDYKNLIKNKWFVVVSEKIVAISQGRAYFIWDIKPNIFARVLSKFVRRTPYGIGLGSPWTMQLAINEVGLVRILLASFASFITKPFGMKGIFYQIAGREAAAIDGPTEYSLYPSNVSAKLGPKEPDKAAEEIKKTIISNFQFPISKKTTNYNLQPINFLGAAIIDANDLGQNVLGNSTNLDNNLIERIFKDNPMGQSDEQTPVTLVFYDGN